MYEILKQYEKIGKRILPIDELRNLLGIEKNEYKRFGDFRIKVLDACQQALKEGTDIQFSYAPCGKKGPGGKIIFLEFIIKKNTAYVDRLTLDRFIDCSRVQREKKSEMSEYDRKMEFLAEACENEFSTKQIMVLYDSMVENLSADIISNDLECYNYLMRKYREMEMRNEKTKIKYRFSYLKKLIEPN